MISILDDSSGELLINQIPLICSYGEVNDLLQPFRHIREGDFVYFVHSYSAVDCGDSLAAVTEYGADLTACVWKDNVSGCQFHPEKSGKTGLAILRAFCEVSA